jgi:hypothetical protein
VRTGRREGLRLVHLQVSAARGVCPRDCFSGSVVVLVAHAASPRRHDGPINFVSGAATSSWLKAGTHHGTAPLSQKGERAWHVEFDVGVEGADPGLAPVGGAWGIILNSRMFLRAPFATAPAKNFPGVTKPSVGTAQVERSNDVRWSLM